VHEMAGNWAFFDEKKRFYIVSLLTLQRKQQAKIRKKAELVPMK